MKNNLVLSDVELFSQNILNIFDIILEISFLSSDRISKRIRKRAEKEHNCFLKFKDIIIFNLNNINKDSFMQCYDNINNVLKNIKCGVLLTYQLLSVRRSLDRLNFYINSIKDELKNYKFGNSLDK